MLCQPSYIVDDEDIELEEDEEDLEREEDRLVDLVVMDSSHCLQIGMHFPNKPAYLANTFLFKQ